MKHDELKGLLAEINEVQVTDNVHNFKIYIPAISKEIILFSKEVVSWSFIPDPFGNEALLVQINKSSDEEYKLIIAPKDLVFEPVESSESLGLNPFVLLNVSDMPPMVSYSEMIRDFTKIKNGITTIRFDHLLGSIILLRYFLNGAERIGIDCQELNQEWQSIVEDSSFDRIFSTGGSKNIPDEKPPVI